MADHRTEDAERELSKAAARVVKLESFVEQVANTCHGMAACNPGCLGCRARDFVRLTGDSLLEQTMRENTSLHTKLAATEARAALERTRADLQVSRAEQAEAEVERFGASCAELVGEVGRLRDGNDRAVRDLDGYETGLHAALARAEQSEAELERERAERKGAIDEALVSAIEDRDAEIERLRALLAKLDTEQRECECGRAPVIHVRDTCGQCLLEEADKALAAERLREALGFYSGRANYKSGTGVLNISIVEQDRGRVARRALTATAPVDDTTERQKLRVAIERCVPWASTLLSDAIADDPDGAWATEARECVLALDALTPPADDTPGEPK